MKDAYDEFKLPKNIKQIGSIDEEFKIYVEDYVFTFLQQYAKDAKGEEKIAALIGETYKIDGNEVLFINGAIRGEHTVYENGMLKFSEKSFEYIQENIEKYFKESKIVGWFYSQPGFSDYVNESYIQYYKENFKESFQVFLLNDPLENLNIFFKFRNRVFDNIKGFIVYYEKNEPMSEYMVSTKNNTINPEKEKFKEKDKKLMQLKPTNKTSKTRFRPLEEHKKMANVFGSLSAVLFLVCFIMGAGLIQNDDRISVLENKLLKLDESYKYILAQVKNNNVQSVFAESNNIKSTSILESLIESTTVETTLETTSEETSKVSETTTNLNQTENTYKTYQVKLGDSLEKISIDFYGTREKIESIMEINDLKDPNKIISGMTLKLP